MKIDFEMSNGKTIRLNRRLIERQQLTQEEVNVIARLHDKKHRIFDRMEREAVPHRLRALANEVKDIEFDLQEAWRFERNAAFHEFWNVPKCTCPKLDNIDCKGSGRMFFAVSCPIHGDVDGSYY